MPHAVHIAIGLVLTASHGLYFFRALLLRKHDRRPGPVDRAARHISHIGLPAAIVTGIIWSGGGGIRWLRVLHTVLGLLPAALIFASAPLLAFKRRIPWLLPGINLILFALAAATGLVLVAGQ